MQSLAISEQVQKLGEGNCGNVTGIEFSIMLSLPGIEVLSQELQKQVLAKHDDLLLQATHATKLELVLNVMNTHVQCLFANVERLRSQVRTYFFVRHPIAVLHHL